MVRPILALFGLTFLAAGASAYAQPAAQPIAAPAACETSRTTERVLLVIGNTGYPGSDDFEPTAPRKWPKLRNARSDAQAICAAFFRQGFRVIKLEDATRDETRTAIEQFAELARQADTAMFYFAGHGFEYAGTNYLVPVDAPTAAASKQLADSYVNLAAAVRATAQARHAIVFLDACRTRDPVVTVSDADPTGPDGPAGVINLPGSFEGVVFYSTARGKPAFDAAPQGEPNSPFAKAVIDRLQIPDLELSRYFAFVRADVKERTFQERGGPQIPTPYGVFDEEFYFRRAIIQPARLERTPSGSSGGGSSAADRQVQAAPVRTDGPTAEDLICQLSGDCGEPAEVDPATPDSRGFKIARKTSPTGEPPQAAAPARTTAKIGATGGRFSAAQPVRPAATSAAGRFAGFDAGRARSAIAALTPEMMRREDEPQLIGRLLGSASAVDVAELAATGDATAQYLYGSMLYQGIGAAKDMARARTALAAAAESGLPAAQLEYAFFLQNFGDGAADKNEARRLFEASAAQGWAKAQSHLAYVLWSSAPPAQDKKRAIALWRQATAGGHAFALYALGAYGGRVDEARQGLKRLAAAGDIGGSAWLCELEHAVDNAKAGTEACLAAAQDGFPGAMAVLAQIYATGQSGPGSAKEARYWARMAAAKPELDPQHRARLQPLLKDR